MIVEMPLTIWIDPSLPPFTVTKLTPKCKRLIAMADFVFWRTGTTVWVIKDTFFPAGSIDGEELIRRCDLRRLQVFLKIERLQDIESLSFLGDGILMKAINKNTSDFKPKIMVL